MWTEQALALEEVVACRMMVAGCTMVVGCMVAESRMVGDGASIRQLQRSSLLKSELSLKPPVSVIPVAGIKEN